MGRTSTRFSAAGFSLALMILAPPARGQVPTISTRQYTGGNVILIVSGSFQISDTVAINTAASVGDGEWTWLQFGVSGSPAPNVLITYGDGEYGIGVGMGKRIATAEAIHCKGSAQVTATSRGSSSFPLTPAELGGVQDGRA